MKSYNKLLSLLTFLAILGLASGNLYSQHLENTATGIVRNAGTIKFVDNAGEFRNAASAATDIALQNGLNATSLESGTILFMGTANKFAGASVLGEGIANRISGWVVYGGAAQTIDGGAAGKYHASLSMLGTGIKSFGATNIFVDSIYSVDKALTTRDYGTGQFTYDGPGDALHDQNIVDEDGLAANTNAYNKLYFMDGGTKTLAAGLAANAVTEINVDADAIVEVQGVMSALGTATVNTAVSATAKTTGLILLDGTGAAAQDGFFITSNGAGTLLGDIFAYNGGTYLVNGTGVQTFTGYVTVGEDVAAAASSGSISIEDGFTAIFNGDGAIGVLDLTNASGAIVVGAGSTAEFAGTLGSFINGVAYDGTEATSPRVNMQFDATSTALYSETARIVGADKGNPYGNLTINGNAAAAEIEGATPGINAYMAGNFTLDGRNFKLDNDADPTNASQYLVMLNDAGTVTYPDDGDGQTEEVVGAFKRFYSDGLAGGTPLTFNNRVTTVDINDTDNDLDTLALFVYPGATPAQPSATDYSATTDIKRRTKLEWAQSGTGWTANLQLGYLATEEPVPGPYPIADLRASYRFRKNKAGQASNKLSTGFDVQRTITFLGTDDNFAYASLAGITSDPSASLTSAILDENPSTAAFGDEVFLRGGPTWFITVRPGRWSNPDTWDEGVQPGPNDLCLVRHTVHAGWVRATDNFQVNEDVHLSTNFATDESELASYIQIYSGTVDAIAYDGALMFGSFDSDGAAPENDNTKTMQNPTWGLRSSLPLSGFTSPFVATGNSEDPSVSEGDIWITQLSGAEANIPVNFATNEQDGNSAQAGIIGGLIVFKGSPVTIDKILTNSGLIVNGGTIQVGP